MKDADKPIFLSTDALTLLSSWKTLKELIIKHTTPIKESVRSDSNDDDQPQAQALLNQQQLDDAFHGPWQHFYQQKLSAFALINRVKMELTIEEEESFKQNRSLSSIDPKEQERFAHALENISHADLDGMRKALNELTTEHEQQWQQQISEWLSEIIKQLNQAELELSILEISEFQNQEPLSELLERFVELNIELPKLKKTEMNFANFLKLKTDITIHSALARQHQPHEQSQIDSRLKKLKAYFNQIDKQEKKLIAEQKKVTDKIVQTIAFAKPKS